MKQKLANMSIRVHLVAALLGLTFLVGVALLTVSATSARNYLHDQLRRRLMATAAAGALTIDGDRLSGLTKRKDESTATYAEVKGRLQQLRAICPGVRYVYTMRPDPDPKRWRFIVDAEEDPRLVSHIGDTYDVSDAPEMWDGLRGPAADRTVGSDRWGAWLSGYAPIKDRQGQTVAILGMDMSAREVREQERAVFPTVAMGLLVCLAVSGLVAHYLSGLFSRPIRTLAAATRVVASGDLNAQVSVGGSRELSTLGGSFNAMTQALRAHHERVAELGNMDFLTSLPNHRYFQERLEQEINRSARYRRPLALVMVDLDHFRQVNATHGHQGGDELLQQVAQVIKEALRECDIVTRYGGEEFAAIMPETTKEEAGEAAERVRLAVAERTFKIRSLGSPKEVQVTVSQGIAGFPDDTSERDGLVVAADLALMRAKYMSRNQTCYFSEDDRRNGGFDPVQLHRALQDASLAAVESLAQALDARDHYTRGHSDNVTRLALAVAAEMGMAPDTQMQLRVAGLLHDIGKIGIPDKVLKKKNGLTRQEWDLIRSHPEVGASILAKAPLLSEIIPIVLAHHEHFDGSGYPSRASGDGIKLEARILAVADAYDAMTSDRPYRHAMAKEDALAELRAHAGSQFDPEVVAAFEMAMKNAEAHELAAHGVGDAI